jgi:hypothetical protein
MPRIHASVLAFAAALTLPAALTAEPAVLSLARAYLGPQSSLDAIQSVRYTGSLDRLDPDSASKAAVHGTIDMVFAKPLRQRQKIVGPKTTLVTVLDGYDAWELLSDNAGVASPMLRWLTVNDVRNLRSSAWENLYYYSQPEGGTVEDMGPATVDGVECERVDFTHDPDSVYRRYFDRDTGRLVLTVRGTESIRESGEIRVEGIRFPKTVVSTTRMPSGKDVVATATFDHISVNEPLPADFFASPSMVPAPAAAPAATPQAK